MADLTCPKCGHTGPEEDFKTLFGECECPRCGMLFNPNAALTENSDLTIVHGDALALAGRLPDRSLDTVITDPPYGEGMGYDGDENVQVASDLLLGFLRVVRPKLKPGAHVSFFWTMRSLPQALEVVATAGYCYRRVIPMVMPRGNARPYLAWLPRTQPIILIQDNVQDGLHAQLAERLHTAMTEAGYTIGSLAKILGCDSRLVMKWTRVNDPAWCLPSPRFQARLKELLGLDASFDILMDRTADGRRRFDYQPDYYLVDEKDLYTGRAHPSIKPLSVVRHLVRTLTPPGGLVGDFFLGSGTTALACREEGRSFIGCDVSAAYCQLARARTFAIKVSHES